VNKWKKTWSLCSLYWKLCKIESFQSVNNLSQLNEGRHVSVQCRIELVDKSRHICDRIINCNKFCGTQNHPERTWWKWNILWSWNILEPEDESFLDIAPCSLVVVEWHFRGAYYLHHQGDEAGGSRHFWNITLLQRDYIAQYAEGYHLHTHCCENLKSHIHGLIDTTSKFRWTSLQC
jgi:hypothetical protein